MRALTWDRTLNLGDLSYQSYVSFMYSLFISSARGHGFCVFSSLLYPQWCNSDFIRYALVCRYNNADGGESNNYYKSPLHIQAVSPLPEFTPLTLALASLGPSMLCSQANTASPRRCLLIGSYHLLIL